VFSISQTAVALGIKMDIADLLGTAAAGRLRMKMQGKQLFEMITPGLSAGRVKTRRLLKQSITPKRARAISALGLKLSDLTARIGVQPALGGARLGA
jgi:hypothetical protein